MTELTQDGWPIVALNDGGIRPAGKPDECFYCYQRVGQLHARDCVTVKKRVKLRYIIEVDVDVPHSWDHNDVEQHRNESTWCASNAIDEIKRHSSDESDGPCLCNRFKCEFVDTIDATPRRELHDEKELSAIEAMREGLKR